MSESKLRMAYMGRRFNNKGQLKAWWFVLQDGSERSWKKTVQRAAFITWITEAIYRRAQ